MRTQMRTQIIRITAACSFAGAFLLVGNTSFGQQQQSSSSLFGNTGSTGSSGSNSSSSLFNNSSSGSSGSSTARTSSSAGPTSTSSAGGTQITAAQIGTSGTPLTRGTPLQRGTTSPNIIATNNNLLPTQDSAGQSNQAANMFANLFGRGQNVQFNAAGTAPRTPLRIPLRVGFVSKPISTAKLTTTFQTRLTKLPALSALGPIEVSMDGSTVVLRGSVASEDDRQLAQDLALLEPAIENVRNELSIQAPETEAAP